MKANLVIAIALFGTLSGMRAAVGADVAKGEELYKANCVACHASRMGGDGSAIYTRADRRVHSLDGLRRQVRACVHNIGITWFDDEIDDVTAFLNNRYYHFDK